MEKIVNCPVCGSKLAIIEKSYICKNKHTFDISKEGYVNLLLCNAKNSKFPGDSKEMLVARRDFLNSGAYEQLLNKIIEIIKTSVLPNSIILEAGCGEGYYISGIKNALKNYSCYGLDISKDAILLASKRNKDVNFYVASSYNTMIQAGKVNCILVVFAPFVEEEYHNILSDNGIVIVVKPRKEHLLELKSHFYETLRSTNYSNYKKFKVIKSYNLTYNINLSTQNMINLFKMTPFFHEVGAKKQENFLKNPLKSAIKVDFLIEVLKK